MNLSIDFCSPGCFDFVDRLGYLKSFGHFDFLSFYLVLIVTKLLHCKSDYLCLEKCYKTLEKSYIIHTFLKEDYNSACIAPMEASSCERTAGKEVVRT